MKPAPPGAKDQRPHYDWCIDVTHPHGETDCVGPPRPPTIEASAARLRALADHLEERLCAPSLEGYGLVDGLRAAADLLEGRPGPAVTPDAGATDDTAFRTRVPLASLETKP